SAIAVRATAKTDSARWRGGDNFIIRRAYGTLRRQAREVFKDRAPISDFLTVAAFTRPFELPSHELLGLVSVSQLQLG
ncbi:MAG: hypothetical protein KAF42_17145, partial [Sphingopyxis terrae]|nr:hypothetical protein [Sphingopyxis terrae]